jgi:hypothetical protein
MAVYGSQYKSSYLLRLFDGDWNPLTPNIIVINNDFIEYRRRNWYLISVDTQTLYLGDVIGIDIDKHLIGATIRIRTSGGSVVVKGFSKGQAGQVKDMCLQMMSAE